jgi:ATP-dependent DNA helicase RecG
MSVKDQEYMDMAIKVMKESVKEKRSDDNPTPFVGAVLVMKNNEVISAHRGELRNGDHAEYTLLDKKLRDKNVTGSIMYVTLEPCAPGARNFPKLSCAERIVNARIGKVFVGHEDPFPTVARKGIKYLQDNGVEVEIFDKDRQKQIEKINSNFFDYAREKAKESEEIKVVELNKIDQIEERAQYDDLSFEAIKYYCESINIEEDQFISYMSKLGLYSDGKWNKQAIILFGKEPRNFYPQAGIKIVNKIGGEAAVSSFSEYNGPMILAPKRIKEWYDQLPKITSRSDIERKNVERYPFIVFREGLINAIVHRDYDYEAAKIHIIVDTEEITIKSPGEPVKGISIEQIRSFSAPSLSRNPKLAFVFNRLGMMEETGYGMETFKSVPKEYNLPSPIIEYDNINIVLRLFLIESARKDAVELFIDENLDEQEAEYYRFIKDNGPISRKKFGDHFDLPSTTSKRILAKLVKLGTIQRKGASVNTRYESLM